MAGPPGGQGPSRGLISSASRSECAGTTTLPGLPGADDSRQERAEFLAKHKICFAIAFQSACLCPECSFNHDPALMPGGYYQAHVATKRVAREVSRPRRRPYALSYEQAHVVAAYFEEDITTFGGQQWTSSAWCRGGLHPWGEKNADLVLRHSHPLFRLTLVRR